MSEKTIIVKDRTTGKPVYISVSRIPESIRPDNWFDNAYWQHRPDSEEFRPIIQKLLDNKQFKKEEAKKLAQYIVDYAAHIAVGVWLFSGGQYLDYYGDLIRKLRQMRDKVVKKKHVMKMLQLGLDQGLDFL